MGMRIAVALTILAGLALPGIAEGGGPRMSVGAVENTLAQSSVQGSAQQAQLAADAGLAGAFRVTATWTRGDTTPAPATLVALRNALAAATAEHADLYLHAYPSGSSQTPTADTDQEQFAGWLASIAQGVPGLRHVIVGNEPNINRFWLPQFGPSGEDVAAPAYLGLLARSYDALKAVSPTIEVLGGALAHAGVDKPGTGRDTHSPTAFITDLGAAYRASGRSLPVMDGFAFHPYMESSNQPPTLVHPNSTTITIGDYGKLVALLGQAFDGTAQRGSTLPIVYDEFGVESTIPAEKQSLYTGAEAATTHPVDEATQAAYYRQALQLAFCQQNVRAILVFSLIDETASSGWQSGVYYADGTPKSSLPAIREAATEARRNVIAGCAGLHVEPVVHADFFPLGNTGNAPSRFPVTITCDVDCAYRLRIVRVATGSTTLVTSGTATGGVPTRAAFRRTRLAPGTYRFTLQALATQNAGETRALGSTSFSVAAPRRHARR
jgi:hypothetical protein